MKKTFLAALLGVATLIPFTAYAEGPYVKLGMGRSDYKDIGADSIKRTGGTLGIGFNLDKTWDVELGYINFGKDTQTNTAPGFSEKIELKSQSVYLAAIGKVPAGEGFSFLGKAGLAVTQTKASSTVTLDNVPLSGSDSVTRLGFLIGTGVAYQFTKEVAATLDYTYFIRPAGSGSAISLVTLGLNYGY
jgi:OOP family OmpA-OmpF porin